jgi:hypothetical protein
MKQSTPAACHSPRAPCSSGWLPHARGAAARPHLELQASGEGHTTFLGDPTQDADEALGEKEGHDRCSGCDIRPRSALTARSAPASSPTEIRPHLRCRRPARHPPRARTGKLNPGHRAPSRTPGGRARPQRPRPQALRRLPLLLFSLLDASPSNSWRPRPGNSEAEEQERGRTRQRSGREGGRGRGAGEREGTESGPREGEDVSAGEICIRRDCPSAAGPRPRHAERIRRWQPIPPRILVVEEVVAPLHEPGKEAKTGGGAAREGRLCQGRDARVGRGGDRAGVGKRSDSWSRQQCKTRLAS